jgi:hypothetical protein
MKLSSLSWSLPLCVFPLSYLPFSLSRSLSGSDPEKNVTYSRTRINHQKSEGYQRVASRNQHI